MTAAATEPLLGILKYVLLALLYVFFARVLWAVWSEVRGPKPNVAVNQAARGRTTPGDPTVAAPSPLDAGDQPRQARHSSPAGSARQRRPVRRHGTESGARASTFAVGDEITIGRAATCTIGMPDDSFVSQLHARVYRDAGSTMIEDLGSTNGTYVNGKRVTAPEQVTKGDRVQIGSTVFEVE